MSDTRTSTKICWGLVAALLLVMAIRLPYVDRAFNDQDVSQIAYSASRMAEGQVLYRDTVDNKPPLALTVFGVTFRAFGKTMTAVNAVALLWALAATVFVFLLTNALFGRTAATGAALFYAVFANGATVNGTSPNYDFWMLPFMVAAVYGFVRGLQNDDEGSVDVGTYERGEFVHTSTRPYVHTSPRSGFWLLTAGVFSGLGVASKQHALFNFAALLSYVVLAALRDATQRRQLPRQLALLSVGFVLAWLPFVLYFWMQGGLSAYFEGVSPSHNVSYAGVVSWKDALYQARYQLTRQITRDTLLWMFALAGLIHLAVGETKSAHQRDKESTGHWSLVTGHCSLLLWLWAFWSFLGVSVTKRFFDHYFQQMMPVFSVLAGYVCGQCFGGAPLRVHLRRMPGLALLTMIAFGFLLSGQPHVIQTLRQAKRVVTGHREPSDLEKIGDYIRARTASDDRIYVWGWRPEIYYFADRKAPTKWWESGVEFGMWQTLRSEFESHKPKFIVINEDLPRWQKFWTAAPADFRDFVNQNYEKDTQITVHQILRLKTPPQAG